MKGTHFDGDIKIISYCPFCENSYSPKAACAISEKGNTHLLHITCGNCSAMLIAHVDIAPSGITSIGLMVDITALEVMPAVHGDPVSADDVLDIHQFLKLRISDDVFRGRCVAKT